MSSSKTQFARQLKLMTLNLQRIEAWPALSSPTCGDRSFSCIMCANASEALFLHFSNLPSEQHIFLDKIDCNNDHVKYTFTPDRGQRYCRPDFTLKQPAVCHNRGYLHSSNGLSKTRYTNSTCVVLWHRSERETRCDKYIVHTEACN